MQSPVLEANCARGRREPFLQFFEDIADQNPPDGICLKSAAEPAVENDPVVVSSIERGKVRVSIEIAEKLAVAVETPLSVIWRQIERRRNSQQTA